MSHPASLRTSLLRLIQGPILLGNLAVALGFITEEQLATALAHQAKVTAGGGRQMLGEVLVAGGYVSVPQLERLLDMQASAVMERSGCRLGEIAIQNGFLTKAQLKEGLRRQKESGGKLLGEVLVEQGVLSTAQVESLLAAQRRIVAERSRLDKALATKEFPLVEGEEWRIGRASDNAIAIVDIEVAPRHARIYLRDGEFFLENLDARAGTWVDGERVEGTVPLSSGAVLVFGTTVLQFRTESEGKTRRRKGHRLVVRDKKPQR